MAQTPAVDCESILADPAETGGTLDLRGYLDLLEKLVEEISAPVGFETGMVTLDGTGAEDGPVAANVTPEILPDFDSSEAVNVNELNDYIPGDALNFRCKDDIGIPFAEIYKKIAQLTNNLTSEIAMQTVESISHLKRVTDEVKLTLEVAYKIRQNKGISEREWMFLNANRGGFYGFNVDDAARLNANTLKSVRSEDLVMDGFTEIQKQSKSTDCTGCGTEHGAWISQAACSIRNLNGPVAPAPQYRAGHWRAAVIGVLSYLTLPWQSDREFLNLGLDRSEYKLGSASNLADEIEPRSTPLGQAILTRIHEVCKAIHVPILIEFNFSAFTEDISYLEALFGFLKVIRSIQKQYIPPIIVILSTTVPPRSNSQTGYQKAKRLAAQRSNIARILGNIMEVPVYEMILQSRPSTKDLTLEFIDSLWLQSDMGFESLFNANCQATPQFYLRLDLALRRLITLINPTVLPKFYLNRTEGEEDWDL